MAKRPIAPPIPMHSNPPPVPLTVTRITRGRARTLGSRDRLTLDEAAAALKRPRAEVERAIRARFLRVVRRNGRRYVTVQACEDFLREEHHDLAIARARRREPGAGVPLEQLVRELGD